MKKKMIGLLGVSLLTAALVGCTNTDTDDKGKNEGLTKVEDIAVNEGTKKTEKLKEAVAKVENREFKYLKDVKWLMTEDEIKKVLESKGYKLSDSSPKEPQTLGDTGDNVIVRIYNDVELDKLGKGSLSFEFTNNLQPFDMEHYLDSKFVGENLLSRITFIKHDGEGLKELKTVTPELFENRLVNLYESEEGPKQVFINFSISRELLETIPSVPLKIKSLDNDKETVFKTNTDEGFTEKDGVMLMDIEGLLAQKEPTSDKLPKKASVFEVSLKNKEYTIHIVDDKKLYISDVTTDEATNYIVKEADGVILSLLTEFGLKKSNDVEETKETTDSKEKDTDSKDKVSE